MMRYSQFALGLIVAEPLTVTVPTAAVTHDVLGEPFAATAGVAASPLHRSDTVRTQVCRLRWRIHESPVRPMRSQKAGSVQKGRGMPRAPARLVSPERA